MKRFGLVVVAACGRLEFDPISDATTSGSLDSLDSQDSPEPSQLPPPDLWFKLNSTAGNMMIDESPLQAHATVTGSFQWTNGRIRLTAADSGGVTPLLPGRFRMAPTTVSAWAACTQRSDSTGVTGYYKPYPPNAVSNDLPDNAGFGFGINAWTDGTAGDGMIVGRGDETTLAGVGCGRLYHVAVVYTAATVELFVDGISLRTVPLFNQDSASASYYIGRHNDDQRYMTRRFFVGEIDDVRVYSSQLTAAQVRRIYDEGPQ